MNNIINSNNNIILSGMRSTGYLHLGHLHGVLKNWIKLQNSKKNNCFFFVADFHALTTKKFSPGEIKNYNYSIISNWIASGINYKKNCIFIQSMIPEITQIHIILSMIMSISTLERVPSYKDAVIKNIKNSLNYGFFGYPVLQTADILSFKATHIPVGYDQIPHIEITRLLARKFNHLYGTKNKNIFFEPNILLTKEHSFPGIDGRKMSKSYDNTIKLIESEDEINKKIIKIKTDTNRIKIDDIGNPEKCNLWKFHKIYLNKKNREEIFFRCTNGKIGCKECKRIALENILDEQIPIKKRSEEIMKDKGFLDQIISDGYSKAREIAINTKNEVFNAIGL